MWWRQTPHLFAAVAHSLWPRKLRQRPCTCRGTASCACEFPATPYISLNNHQLEALPNCKVYRGPARLSGPLRSAPCASACKVLFTYPDTDGRYSACCRNMCCCWSPDRLWGRKLRLALRHLCTGRAVYLAQATARRYRERAAGNYRITELGAPLPS